MDEMETPCKRMKLDHEGENFKEDNLEKDDISKTTQMNLVKESHKDGHFRIDGAISSEKDLKILSEKEIQDTDFSRDISPSLDSGKRRKSMDLTNSSTGPQQTVENHASSALPDESEASEPDEQNESEMDQLREFQVLDEVADDDKKDSDDNDSDSESEKELAGEGEEEILDIPDDEIEQMLEENLPEDFKGQPKPKPRPYGQRKKLVLEEKGINHFEVLPLDWIVVRHMSGMPIYLHRPTRVCTLAKPYFLGKASARRHEIPISAIPCLNYRRALEEEEKQMDVDNTKTVDLTNETDVSKSDAANGKTENLNSKESTLSQCPFSKEQSNSNSESNSQDESNFKVDTNFANSSKENSRQISNELANNVSTDLTNATDIPKSHAANENTENIDSEESSLSQCPFSKEKSDSNSELNSHDNTNVEIDTNSTNSSEENSRHISNEFATIVSNGDIADGNECILNGIDSDSTSSLTNLTVASVTNIADSEMTEDIEMNENKPDSSEKSKSKDGIDNDSTSSLTNLTVASVTNMADSEMTEDIEINGNKADSSEKSKSKDSITNSKSLVSSSTNSAVSPSANNVDDVENEAVTSTSRENVNTADDGTSAKSVGITANIMIVGNKKMLPGGIILPNVKIETAGQENWKNKHLTHEQVTEYCKKLFRFRTINIMRFEQWSDRRKYSMAKKKMQRPTLPEGTKLLTIPAQPADSGSTGLSGRPGQKEWVMNPNGRSYVCIFHEYVQRVLQKKPTYEFVQLENALTPYKVTVFLNGMQYGVGYGTSKRQAKSMAAKASIEVLIPEMRDKVTEDSKMDGVACRSDNPDFAFFDFVTIEDPRIAEFCAKTMEPSPHAILHTCLLRNFGVGSQEIKYETKPIKRQRIEFTMSVGKHTATVVCKKKKDGKQRAAQAILQALHPHIKSWGSLLRLYGSRSLKSFKEKKIEEQEITLLQGKAMVNTPNFAILNKLKAEMERLRERDTAVVPIGTLVVTDSLPTHSGSNLDNVEI